MYAVQSFQSGKRTVKKNKSQITNDILDMYVDFCAQLYKHVFNIKHTHDSVYMILLWQALQCCKMMIKVWKIMVKREPFGSWKETIAKPYFSLSHWHVLISVHIWKIVIIQTEQDIYYWTEEVDIAVSLKKVISKGSENHRARSTRMKLNMILKS